VGAAVILAGTLLLPACESGDAVSREAEAAAVQRPNRGGTFRILVEAPHYLDPASVDSVYDALPVGQIFDGLVALDPGLNIVPELADTWTISHDGRDYMIHLRDGVRFHDGTPLTADDVVFSIRRLLDPKREKTSIGVSYLQVIEGAPAYCNGKARELPGVVAIDPSRVEIKLTRPYLSFLAVLAMDDLRIVPRKAVTEMGDAAFRRRPVGTGPFRFKSWNDSELRLSANPDYFGGEPYLDEIEILFPRADEHDAGNARFLRGETDIVQDPSRVQESYSAEKWKRLEEVRAKYDPHGVFFGFLGGTGKV
jgi:ABC-type transport system substrate-binding protein